MYRYAYSNNLCERGISVGITINITDDDEKGVPFSVNDIKTLWIHKDDNNIVKCILIMIYSGFRISEYQTLEIESSEALINTALFSLLRVSQIFLLT